MKISYPETLPISSCRGEIIEAIRSNQVIIIAGDTGSGKTTQIPKFCLETMASSKKLIGCTQPRRLAATSVALRVREELAELGNLVGYKIRFQDKTNPETRIKFMTDGVLLAETAQSRKLSQYGVIIIDEAHERSLNIDFLLGYLKRLLPLRPDLKVIITSATIDTEAFSRHFNDAPVITVSGRTYPVELQYRPLSCGAEDTENTTNTEKELMDHCVETIQSLCNSGARGDILAFLPTERDIKECCRLLEGSLDHAVILPLFGRLSLQDQQKVFRPAQTVKVVVATNVAETSVTVPGIRYVIDTGLARISRYNVRAKTTSLPIVRISRASADQRKGRCGRVGNGICIRLYSEEDYADRPEFTVPELQRSNLAEVILKMLSLELGNPHDFPFIDSPSSGAVAEGYRLLGELGAIDRNRLLTKRGQQMARMPIDPCISRIILEATANHCLREIKIISSVLAIQDPRIRPSDHEKQADAVHAELAHPHSDFMTLLALWNTYHKDTKNNRSWSKMKKFCSAHFLSLQRMREWFDLHDQLNRITSSMSDLTDNKEDASYEQIHKSLLAGFARNISTKKDKRIYQGAGGKELMIFPGSHQFLRGGQWIIAAAFLETGRLYALTVATVEPEWIEEVASHLCRYNHHSPRWHKKSGQVMATESVSIFGLVLVADRFVNFGRHFQKNRTEARRIFITEGLVPGEINGTYTFLTKNFDLIKKWRDKEARLRSRSILVDESQLIAFYEQKLPNFVYDQRSLNRWLKKSSGHDCLTMQEADILIRRIEEKELVDFPHVLQFNQLQIDLKYHFEPGSDLDGVTFLLPMDIAFLLRPEKFEWLVPGLLREKLTYMLKSLPKAIRKKLVPVNETVDRLLDDMKIGEGSFESALQNALLKNYRILVHRSDWPKALPLHLRPRFLLLDEKRNTLGSGRDLQQLLAGQSSHKRKSGRSRLSSTNRNTLSQWENTLHTTWSFTSIPEPLPMRDDFNQITGFLHPALQALDDRSAVKVVFVRDPQQGRTMTQKGNLLLCCLHFSAQYKSLKKFCSTTFSGPSAKWLIQLGQPKNELVQDLLTTITKQIFSPLPETIINQDDFVRLCSKIEKRGFFSAGQHICQQFMELLRKRRQVDEFIRKVFAPTRKGLGYPEADREEFVNFLDEIFPIDLLKTELEISFDDIARYLNSLSLRLERYNSNPEKDRQKASLLQPFISRLNDPAFQNSTSEDTNILLTEFRMLLREYHISIFSPELKTRMPVSPRLLDRKWQDIFTRR